ncbi:MAG: hypothetical protein Q7R83_02250 [bacterium]|nr:hypothetical protein [bacterium]
MKQLFRILLAILILVELAGYLNFIFKPVFTWFGLLITASVIIAGIEAVNLWVKRRGSPDGLSWIVWALASLSLYVDVFGDLFHGYARWVWYDQMAHTVGGFVVFTILYLTMRAFRKTDARPLVLPATMTIALGILYELEEYLEDLFTGSHRSGGTGDTANDFLCNLVGLFVAFLTVSLGRRVVARRRNRYVLKEKMVSPPAAH